MIALLDCNNFYVSCERIFNRKLINKPVVVLSNNDGCIISRSDEVKKMGIKMGEPFFKNKKKLEQLNVHVCSSNYSLYGDISNRVMNIIRKSSKDMEIYSIDEAFISLQGLKQYHEFCSMLKKKILKWTGIPVSIGVGKTKTLSKIANKVAKQPVIFDKNIGLNSGIYGLYNEKQIDYILQRVNIEDVWGIGRKLSYFFRINGIESAYKLKKISQKFALQKKGVLVSKTILELRGIKCYELEKKKVRKKSICVSRSFGQKLDKYYDIRDALIVYVQKASEKLRQYKLFCTSVTVFLQTSRYQKQHYKNLNTYSFTEPTLDSRKIWIVANKLLISIYKEGYSFNKVGVILSNLKINQEIQNYLFHKDFNNRKIFLNKSYNLMLAIDKINNKFGNRKIRIASDSGARFFEKKNDKKKNKNKWLMKSDYTSPCYTTNWCDIPKVIIN